MIVEEITAPLVTCEAVIAESCYLLRSIPPAVDAILANVESGIFQLPFHLTSATAEVRRIVRRYRNIGADLADACLVYLATEFQTPNILTLDKDFKVYRWGKNRPFENLLGL
jgi:predicted nucleic acid-binding protein